SDGSTTHVLCDTVVLLLGVPETVTFDGTVATVASSGLVEPHKALIAYKDKLNQIHKDGLARTSHTGQQQVALDWNGVFVAIPVERMDASEADGAVHSSFSASPFSSTSTSPVGISLTEAKYRSAFLFQSSMFWKGMTRFKVGKISICERSNVTSRVT